MNATDTVGLAFGIEQDAADSARGLAIGQRVFRQHSEVRERIRFDRTDAVAQSIVKTQRFKGRCVANQCSRLTSRNQGRTGTQ